MGSPKVDAGDLLATIKRRGVTGASKALGIDRRNVQRRRDRLTEAIAAERAYPWRFQFNIRNGTAIIFADCHYGIGPVTLMHRALVFMCKELKPNLVVCNGDVIDAPTISRHARIGWEQQPELVDELEFSQDALHEIEKASGKAIRVWNLGNHDARFETRLANIAPQYAKIHGVHLKDHFPNWEPAWATWVNDDMVVKHKFRGGDHATWNNVVRGGKTMVTGHLHSAKVTPFTDYRGTRYGVDTGCIADPLAKKFTDYTEDNPKNWRSGCGVFTFRDGKLMEPELVLPWDTKRVQFRGDVFTP